MKTHQLILLMLLSIFVVACNSQAPTLSDSQRAEAEKQIREISIKWLELWKSHDLEGLKTLFADDAVVYRLNIEPAVGLAAIIDVYAKEFEQNPQGTTEWSTERVEISTSGDMAIEYGSFSVAAMGPNGTVDDHGRFVTVYRNINGTWKVYSDIGSSTKPLIQKADAEKQIREISAKWLELWNKRDIEGLKLFFTDDAIVYRQNTPPSVGPTAIGETYAKEFKQNPKMVSNWKTDKVEVSISGDYAVEYGSYWDKGLGPNGNIEANGNYVTVYRNINSVWKAYSDISSVTKPVEPAK